MTEDLTGNSVSGHLGIVGTTQQALGPVSHTLKALWPCSSVRGGAGFSFSLSSPHPHPTLSLGGRGTHSAGAGASCGHL